MYELARNNYLEGLETKIDFLKNEGTSHEVFSKFIRDGMRSHNTKSSEILSIGDKVKEMDKNDLSNPLNMISTHCIHVMPFGYFMFETHLLETVLDILNVENFAKETFRTLIKSDIVPVANIFDNPILQEGPSQGINYSVGVETHRRFYDIRVGLKEVGAKLIELRSN
ncbi:hypothetical protein SAMN05660841_00001 [Sphingobacterium nematocida]|uniref:Uncharacterized protein n=1 Tax=Sphingobacterium nematocida TaxID=1513896 RepID=A0A1T5AMD4_9SPHI|nr:hypothetical protein [Sphingobacterium nematocida]SKB35989.1 hypothetical protein SAMN05660841_00001 [Sphingobacterium nematocida]